MNTPDSITQRIHDKADTELKCRQDDLFQKCFHEFYNGSRQEIMLEGYLEGEQGPRRRFVTTSQEAFQALKRLAFEVMRDEARKKALDDFMAQLERLGAEIDELRDSIGGGQ